MKSHGRALWACATSRFKARISAWGSSGCSISAEMQAHATLCDMRQRELLAHRDRLEQELRELQAENP